MRRAAAEEPELDKRARPWGQRKTQTAKAKIRRTDRPTGTCSDDAGYT